MPTLEQISQDYKTQKFKGVKYSKPMLEAHIDVLKPNTSQRLQSNFEGENEGINWAKWAILLLVIL